MRRLLRVILSLTSAVLLALAILLRFGDPYIVRSMEWSQKWGRIAAYVGTGRICVCHSSHSVGSSWSMRATSPLFVTIPGILERDSRGSDEAPYLTSAHVGIWTYRSGDPSFPTRWVSFPSAYLYPFLAALPALSLYRFARRRHRFIEGLCPICSYDLRAHSPGQSCPECGTPISIDPPAAKPIHSNP
jgi:hypothetical protein